MQNSNNAARQFFVPTKLLLVTPTSFSLLQPMPLCAWAAGVYIQPHEKCYECIVTVTTIFAQRFALLRGYNFGYVRRFVGSSCLRSSCLEHCGRKFCSLLLCSICPKSGTQYIMGMGFGMCCMGACMYARGRPRFGGGGDPQL